MHPSLLLSEQPVNFILRALRAVPIVESSALPPPFLECW
jgi:hypothetical protein